MQKCIRVQFKLSKNTIGGVVARETHPISPWHRSTHCRLTERIKRSEHVVRSVRQRRIASRRRHVVLSAAAGAGGYAAAAFQALGYIRSSIDPIVLGATATASYKLFIVCAAVGWLLKMKRIPDATASVLSQISFQLLIPCMLFSKVAAMLASAPDASLLLGMAGAAIAQIVMGALWGILLAPLVDQRSSKELSIFGWKPFGTPPRSAAVIAAATASATGVPFAAAALLPRPPPVVPGLRELVTAASAFGNSFTLPAVFFMTLLPPGLSDRAVAYSGLFLLAWSPCLWSVGLSLVERGFEGNQALKENPCNNEESDPPMDVHPRGSSWNWLMSLNKGILRSLNPPVVSILLGMLVGLSPFGRQVLLSLRGPHGADVARLPFELSLGWTGLKGAYEVIEMLAAGTLAMQTLVLASSLLQKSGQAPQRMESESGGMVKSFLKAVMPTDATEARVLGVLFLVRFILLPTTAIVTWQWVARAPWAAPLVADPLFLFVIAVQAVMPSAQNLIIMLQLSDTMRPVAPAFARLLLKLYAYAVLPVTLWVTAFASRLSIPLG